MEERCAQFQADAARPRDPVKTVKEIERLRKFLFKNQEYRFTDREQTHLFGAIQAHYAAHCELSETEREPALMLVDDALKMPFTVFTTSHKKTYLKWHAKLTGEGDKGQQRGAAAAGGGKPVAYTVYDLPEGGACLGLMTDEGDTLELQLAGPGACQPELLAQIRAAFEAGEDEVRVTVNDDRTTVTGLLGAKS